MRAIEIYSYGALASISQSSILKNKKIAHQSLRFNRTKIRAETPQEYEEPCVKFQFVSSVLLPDVQLRKACGGQKLRDIMLDAKVELQDLCSIVGEEELVPHGLVEVVEGKELLNPRTDKENENLKRHPKNWRFACQARVGKPDSRGMMIIQQLPEWKAHEWNYRELPPIEEEEESSSVSSSLA
ncbi:hypothetical protein RND71_016930 [Anisodus tanguticus]|uniref:Uncharacterized protein n=1 Tax=Anisodus tanguticus TaxID=243964 RepID=A0AAE1VE65_9SOLA|nr:hypothetical protein RND71_016930 [Anisodus tanguticus]